MRATLRLLRIAVQHVGILGDRRVELAPLVPGINVVSGPNESGKSTLVRALRAALFQRHGSKHEMIRSLRPRGSERAAPRVEVDFEIGGVVYQLEKQFLSGVFSRLRCKDGSLSLEGDEADQKVLALLGAREPAKKGINLDDMGVWSLLWVNQDEFATVEPGKHLGDHVRSTLATAIRGIVGDVMGGERGVQLRRAIEESYSKLWTPKQSDRATGELARARETVGRLEEEVKTLEEKVRSTETLGADLQNLEQELERLREEGIERAQELEQCARAVDEVEAIERRLQEASLHFGEARRRHEETLAAREGRRRLRKELAALEDAVRAHQEAFEPLEREAVQAREAQRLAEQKARDACDEYDRFQRQVAELNESLARIQQREAFVRKEEALVEAMALNRQVEALHKDLRRLPDEKILRGLRELEAKRQVLTQNLHRHATRVTVSCPGEQTMEIPVPHRSTISLGARGSVTVEAPRKGFLEARRALRESQTKLQATLDSLGVASVGEAREIAMRRRLAEQKLEEAQAQLSRHAPRGVTELAVSVERADRECAEIEKSLAEARRLRTEIERAEQLEAGIPIEAETLRRLEGLERALRDREAQMSVNPLRFTLRPLATVNVQIGDRTPPQVLSVGMEVKRSVTTCTTVTVADLIEVEIDPGSDAQARAFALDEARRAFDTALRELGVASVEEAREQARMRDEHRSRRMALAEELRKLAPKGIEVLAEQLPRKVQEVTQARQRLREAREHEGRLAQAEREVHDNAIAFPAFEALDALDRRCFEEEQKLRQLAGRIVSADGDLSTRWSLPQELVDDVSVTLDDVSLTITLGEECHDAELRGIERSIAQHLEDYGLVSVDEAVDAHGRWRERQARASELQHTIERLAPQGLAALEAEVASLKARTHLQETLPTRDEVEVELAVRQKLLDEATSRWQQSEARLRAMGALVQEKESARQQAERSLRDREVERNVKRSELQGEEKLVDDATLDARYEDAARALDEARRLQQVAQEALDARMPEVCRRNLERARRSCDEHKRTLEAKRTEEIELRARLEASLPEGCYEKLSEKRAELEDARHALARLERSARALKLLRETAEQAYSEAQRVLMEPVSNEALPLLRMIRPGTTFTMEGDTLQLASVNRNGFNEEFKELSGGAREQLALVVRIALARVFARQQLALPMILDDVLGWTDDTRLRGMLNVLEQTARDMQVILLTCHPARFRGLEGAARFELQRL